jgi:tRNA G37 N-methylase TrmD
VPDVLLSGNFARIDRWKEEQAWERTKRLRPDLPKVYRYAKLVAFAFHTQRDTAGLPAHRVAARKDTH